MRHSSSTLVTQGAETDAEICCPRFDPAPWRDKEVQWDAKRFVKGHVRSLIHVPLNFSTVMSSLQNHIESAEAMERPMLCLSDETSPWGSDVYIAVTKNVPDCEMATISGTFLTKVFEGPYRNAGAWVREMSAFVRSRGKELKKLYFFYTTCPRCAQAHGKNYVVLFAQIS